MSTNYDAASDLRTDFDGASDLRKRALAAVQKARAAEERQYVQELRRWHSSARLKYAQLSQELLGLAGMLDDEATVRPLGRRVEDTELIGTTGGERIIFKAANRDQAREGAAPIWVMTWTCPSCAGTHSGLLDLVALGAAMDEHECGED